MVIKYSSQGYSRVPQKGVRFVATSDRHFHCPECGSRKLYTLADGRRKCKQCRKRFTPRARKRQLPKHMIKEIVRLFWLMVPASRVAKDLGKNPKTILGYYNKLRCIISEESTHSCDQFSGEVEVDEAYFGGVRKGKRGRGAGGKIPVFGLLKRNGEVKVVFPSRVDKETLQGAIKTHVKPLSWVYSDSFRAYDRLDLEGFHHVRIRHEKTFGGGTRHINSIENFWGFAKRRLKMYHGGYKRNFVLFMREMEYRFNHRNDSMVIDHLTNLLLFGPI
jgi:transposase